MQLNQQLQYLQQQHHQQQLQTAVAQSSHLLPQQAKPQSSCIFIGNIPYDSTDRDLCDTLRMVGPFNLFRLKLEKATHQPKGFGFCEYKDQDVASSALRNLNKFDLNRRELKVDFANDILRSLSPKQEQMLLLSIKEVYERYEKENNIEMINRLINALAENENLMEKLSAMLDRQLSNTN
ncbi:mrna splicing [Stylonychia lemnae]|uniref:Mrna splicing n=1 Tax=Stylonychia lemnae TaxID=5949 RepID=A0A078AFX8_STYLE|nr:mrna splicing [Stylonychia lemnae]|eukprot:CDW80751.1 mrna splicing [Stylonychia lemnae]